MKIYNCRICGRDVDYDEGHGCALATPANERHRITLKERDALAAENRELRERLGDAERLLGQLQWAPESDGWRTCHGCGNRWNGIGVGEHGRACPIAKFLAPSPPNSSPAATITLSKGPDAGTHPWPAAPPVSTVDSRLAALDAKLRDVDDRFNCNTDTYNLHRREHYALEARVAALEMWRGSQNNALAKPEAICKHGVAMDDHCRPCEPATSADRVPMSLNKEGYEIGHQFRDNGQGWCASGCGQTQGGHNPEAAEAVPAPPEPHAFVLGEGENRRIGWCCFEPRPHFICAKPKGDPVHAVPGVAK